MSRKGIESIIALELRARTEKGDSLTERLRKAVHSIKEASA